MRPRLSMLEMTLSLKEKGRVTAVPQQNALEKGLRLEAGMRVVGEKQTCQCQHRQLWFIDTRHKLDMFATAHQNHCRLMVILMTLPPHHLSRLPMLSTNIPEISRLVNLTLPT